MTRVMLIWMVGMVVIMTVMTITMFSIEMIGITMGVDECTDSCDELNKEYYRYDKGGFGSNECWCKDGERTIQIW